MEIRGKVKERKTGGWNHRKGQSGSERTKEEAQLEREAERLKCKYSQKKGREGD